MLDTTNLVLVTLIAGAGYLLAREFSRKDATENMVVELSKAVVAIQGAVEALKEFNAGHEAAIAEVRKERHDCELSCPYRIGVHL